MTHRPPVPLCRPELSPHASAALAACVASGWLGYGPRCHELERRFAARGGHALATSCCTSALHLAAKAMQPRSGDEVIVPAITFVSTAMAFLYASFRVSIADVCADTGMMESESVEAAISPRTRAVVAVHLFGQRASCAALRTLCDRHGLLLIEDCAHRLDLLDPVPPAGDVACYSFNAVKEAPAGEGGLIWWRPEGWDERLRSLSNVGLTVDTPQRTSTCAHRDYAFGAGEIGLKLRGNDLAAALANAALDELVASRAARAELFARFDRHIAAIGPIVRPLQRADDDSFLMYVVRVPAEARDVLRSAMAEHGVATSVHYPSLSRHPLLARSPCAVAERLDGEILTVPCFPGLSRDAQDRVLEALASGARRVNGA